MSDEEIIERAARAAHEANRAYCRAIGDDSQVPWDEAPEWQKASARKGVEYLIGNPVAQPSDSHDSWLREKEADGWRYSPVKDVEKKEHSCFVPYHELPEWQRAKDSIFLAVVRGVLAREGARAAEALVDLMEKSE